MDGCEVQQEQPFRDLGIGLLLDYRSVDDPLKDIVLDKDFLLLA